MLNLSIHGYVALLIDADNVNLNYIEQILSVAEYYGTLEICRAYGDWEQPQLAKWCEKIQACQIEKIQVKGGEKDATDIRLSLDAGIILGGEAYEDQPNVFVIVSGDGGFAATYATIKEMGKQVIGIGNSQHTSKILEAICDTFHYIENLDSELSEAQKRYPIPPDKVQKFFKILRSAYIWIADHREAWVTYSQLGNQLRKINPDYKSEFGMYTLTQWLRNFEQDFENIDQRIRGIDRYPELTRRHFIINAYIKTYESEGLASLSQLSEVLREIDSNHERHFGSKQLSEWLKDYPEFKIHNNCVVHQNYWRNKAVVAFLSQPAT